MSASMSHALYEELLVGHALSALEPQDEQALLQHLPTCAACERDLAEHRETLGHLASAAEQPPLPASLWDGIRAQVVAESGPGAFPVAAESVLAPVADLGAARARRLRSRPGAWASVAAAVAVVAAVSVGVTGMVRDHDQQGVSSRLAAAVRSVESGPGQTVPLAPQGGGKAVAVAVVQSDRVSLIVDGLPSNDATSSVYVLWGQSGAEPAVALGTFDVHGSLDVVRDLARMSPGAHVPQLLVITKESGRTAPAVAAGAALATGRAA